MRQSLGIASLILACLPAVGAGTQESIPLDVRHYSVRYHLFPERGWLQGSVSLTLTNPGPDARTEASFVLYRLLEVSEVRSDDGNRLPFRQRVVRIASHERFQVNHITVLFPHALDPGAEVVVTLEYGGPFAGAQEVWPYLHDRVSPDFSLLRVDALPYPVLSGTDRVGVGPHLRFTFDLEVVAPPGVAVVAGAEGGEADRGEDGTTWRFRALRPTWRIDVAAGPYGSLTDRETSMTVHYMEADEVQAVALLHAMGRASRFFTELFGAPPGSVGYQAIEIPDGWGSQAGDGYFLQTSGAFRDPARLHELYHEIAHAWNPAIHPAVQGSRWFDEAFASYFEALALRELDGEEAFAGRMDAFRRFFLTRAGADPKVLMTPIVEYGSAGLSVHSYAKGAWSLYVLHEALGEADFRLVVRTLLARHALDPADFGSFRRIVVEIGGAWADPFFEEWIYGVESSRLLQDGLSVEEMAARYQINR